MQIYAIMINFAHLKHTLIMAHRIVVGITQGDSNGVGYEVIIKALSDSRMLDMCVPVLYGNSRTLGLYRKMIPETDQISTNVINSAADARGKRLNIINCVSDQLPVEPGQPTEAGAKAAIQALDAAVKDLKDGLIDALVTAPINKHTVAALGFGFPGHTEYLMDKFGSTEGLMFMCTDTLKIGLVTNHEPLGNVVTLIDKDLIVRKLRLMDVSLKRDFAKDRPTIAVLGLNPHAGDAGYLGAEEKEIVIPAIDQANAEGILAFGPYRLLRQQYAIQIRRSAGNVPRPGTDSVQGACIRQRRQLHGRPPYRTHISRPRHRLRHRRKESGQPGFSYRRHLYGNRHMPKPYGI